MKRGDLPNAPDSPSKADAQSGEERPEALQLFLESIPAKIDAIKNRRQEEAIELRRFMMERERRKRAKR
jgi:hypothetical protein